ncbi:MAG: hypothetical protein R3Y47_05955 [Lachnospiraceae bacterium]
MPNKKADRHIKNLTIREIAIFAMLAAIMYLSKIIMQWIPNIHLLGTFIMAFTIVYRKKALVPLYVYVMLDGIFSGFAIWWIPYLYIWTVLWGVTMLLPKHMNKKVQVIVYMIVCGLHGLGFGILYAPAQALFFGLSFEGMIAWIIYGLPFDITHGVGNLMAGTLIVPIVSLLRKLESARWY